MKLQTIAILIILLSMASVSGYQQVAGITELIYPQEAWCEDYFVITVGVKNFAKYEGTECEIKVMTEGKQVGGWKAFLEFNEEQIVDIPVYYPGYDLSLIHI